MKTRNFTISTLLFVCLFYAPCFSQTDSVKVKVKRTYSKGKLEQEEFYDMQGRLTKSATPNYSFFRGCEYGSISYNYDTLASVYEYNDHSPQKKSYGYHVEKGEKSELKLYGECYYKKGLLIKRKEYYIPNKPESEYFEYNKHGDCIKNETTSGDIYLFDYIYTPDSLIQIKIQYSNSRDTLSYRIAYDYNVFKQIEKRYYFDFNDKLTSIEFYYYNTLHQLITIETIDFHAYTHYSQRKESKMFMHYKYNNYGLVIEEQRIDPYWKNNDYLYTYEYEYY